jgi:chromosome partitioning protein
MPHGSAVSTVGFVSEKGGVGKTTACYHIAVALARFHGKRVLVVDTDYQRGGISGRFLPNILVDFRNGATPGVTLYQKYQGLYADSPFTANIDIRQTAQNVDLIPADPRLATVSVEKMPASNNIRENNIKLWNHLSLVRRVLDPLANEYDYILVDSHPEVSDVLRSVIYACDFIVSPVKLDLQSTIGVPTAIQVMNEVNADVSMVQAAVPTLQAPPPTQFVGAIGMMAREWGGILKQTERTQYRRLQQTGGIFDNYVTEGDGLRLAAEARSDVYNVGGANAEKQADQFRAITLEFMQKCP